MRDGATFRSAPEYAWICGDVIGVGDFWPEVPEIAEAGSKWGELMGYASHLLDECPRFPGKNSLNQCLD